MAKTVLDFRLLPRVQFALDLSISTLMLGLKSVGEELKAGIREHTPRGSGKLWYKCKVIRVVHTAYTGKVRVGWLRKDFERKKFYAIFVGEGTGLYSSGTPKEIAPVKKAKRPLIRYQYKGRWVSSKTVKGQRPKHMLEKGYKTALPHIYAYMTRTFYRTMRVSKIA